MRAFLAVTVCCISLLPALPVRSPLERTRLDFMTRPDQLSLENTISPDVTEHANTDHDVSIDRNVLWRTILSRAPPSASKNPNGFHIDSQPIGGESNEVGVVLQHRRSEVGGVPQQRGLRGRRHTLFQGRHNHHHVKLMRVGCILGTCQVQNLSHRLFQLAGQNGRETPPLLTLAVHTATDESWRMPG